MSLAKRNKDQNNLPYVHPTLLLGGLNFESESEKKRYEALHQNLTNLKFLIEKRKTNSDYDMIKDFLIMNKISEESFFTHENLFKISQFVKKDLEVFPQETLLDTLKRVVNHKGKVSIPMITTKPSPLKKKVIKPIVIHNKDMNSFSMKEYLDTLEKNFNQRYIPSKHSQKETIKKLEKELSSAKEKAISKKMARANSKLLNKDIGEDDVDSDFDFDDIENIKKNGIIIVLS